MLPASCTWHPFLRSQRYALACWLQSERKSPSQVSESKVQASSNSAHPMLCHGEASFEQVEQADPVTLCSSHLYQMSMRARRRRPFMVAKTSKHGLSDPLYLPSALIHGHSVTSARNCNPCSSIDDGYYAALFGKFLYIWFYFGNVECMEALIANTSHSVTIRGI